MRVLEAEFKEGDRIVVDVDHHQLTFDKKQAVSGSVIG
jgi:hypothetical protein